MRLDDQWDTDEILRWLGVAILGAFATALWAGVLYFVLGLAGCVAL